MKKTILLGLLSSGLLFSQASNAGEWAIGAVLGQSDADVCSSFPGFSCDDTDTSYGLNVSYDFNKAWGVELGYTELGDFELAGFDIDSSALHFAGTGTVNFNDYWSLTGRLGISDVDSSTLGLSDSETGLFAGASLNYNFNDNLQAQLRYDNYDGDGDNVALGLKYSFGK